MTTPAPPDPPDFIQNVLSETEAMASYALAQGTSVPAEVVSGLARLREVLGGSGNGTAAGPEEAKAETNTPLQLGKLHQQLAGLVSPATPGALLLMARHAQQSGWLRLLGPVRVVRQMMLAALCFLLTLLALSTQDRISAENIAKGFFDNAGYDQVYCQGFLLAASGLGACFSALFQINRYVGQGSYDPKYDASYWSRLVLGLMAGIMVAELVGPHFIAQVPPTATDGPSAQGAFGKPTLALLGGFSASLVHRVLEKLVQSLESLIGSGADKVLKDKEERMRMQVDAESVEARMKLASRLSALQSTHKGNPAVQGQLSQLLNELLSSDGLKHAPAKGPPPDAPPPARGEPSDDPQAAEGK